MSFVFGRENLALTIFVPFDCHNNCAFCTSKQTYKTDPPNVELVKAGVRSFFKDYRFPIKDVVFTGGEPMADIDILFELIDMIPSKYNVYINTTFTNKNLDDFVDLVNHCKKIKGVNISRHSETYEDDCRIFCNIAPDESIKRITKPVRINCVVGEQDIERVVSRWAYTGVELCFREDYTKFQNDENHLHDPYGEVPIKLLQMGYQFHSHVQCNVCDTTRFIKEGNIVSFHKGKHHSSILRQYELEINDLIIKQSGQFAYDWGECSFITTLELLKKFENKKLIDRMSPCPSAYTYDSPVHSGGCGGRSESYTYGGCGGGGRSPSSSGCGGRVYSYGGCGSSTSSGCGGVSEYTYSGCGAVSCGGGGGC